MPKTHKKDSRGHLLDNKEYGKAVIGAIRLDVPINRNLAIALFGQLGNLIERKS